MIKNNQGELVLVVDAGTQRAVRGFFFSSPPAEVETEGRGAHGGETALKSREK